MSSIVSIAAVRDVPGPRCSGQLTTDLSYWKERRIGNYPKAVL